MCTVALHCQSVVCMCLVRDFTVKILFIFVGWPKLGFLWVMSGAIFYDNFQFMSDLRDLPVIVLKPQSLYY